MTALIPERLKQLKKVAYFIDRSIEEKVAEEDLVEWAKTPCVDQVLPMVLPFDVKQTPFISLSALIP